MENNHKQYKPFDRILVREGGEWTPDIYSYYNENENKHWCLSFGWLEEDQILPYEGNEHLVGTTDEPEEEIKLEEGEKIYGGNDPSYIFRRDISNVSLWWYWKVDKILDCNVRCLWPGCNPQNIPYFVKATDVNYDSLEETRKHILCVKNGKVVRYKE